MSRVLGLRRLGMLALLILVLIAITGHMFVEVAGAASGETPKGAGLTLASGCLHTSVILPVTPALSLSFDPHFVSGILQPILHGYLAPTPLRPPISVTTY